MIGLDVADEWGCCVSSCICVGLVGSSCDVAIGGKREGVPEVGWTSKFAVEMSLLLTSSVSSQPETIHGVSIPRSSSSKNSACSSMIMFSIRSRNATSISMSGLEQYSSGESIFELSLDPYCLDCMHL